MPRGLPAYKSDLDHGNLEIEAEVYVITKRSRARHFIFVFDRTNRRIFGSGQQRQQPLDIFDKQSYRNDVANCKHLLLVAFSSS